MPSTSVYPHDHGRLPQMTPPNELDPRVTALAQIQQMHHDLMAAHEEIGQLKADLNREQDRVTMVSEERARYRAEANAYRALLVELAANQTSIGLIAQRSETVMRKLTEILEAETPKDGEEHKTKLPPDHTLMQDIGDVYIKDHNNGETPHE